MYYRSKMSLSYLGSPRNNIQSQDLLQSQGFGAEGSLSMALVLKVPQKMPEAVSKHWFSVLPVTNSGIGRGLR